MDIFDKLRNLYEEICSIYRNLFNLEIYGYKNTSLFQKRIEVLKLKLVEEEELLNKLIRCLDYDEIKEEIFSYNGNDEFYFRLKNHLVLYESFNIKIFDDDDEELVNQKNMSMNKLEIFVTSTKNIFLVYASFLQMTIDKLLIKNLKDRLLKLKYYNCINKYYMEKVMVDLNFNIPEEVYTDLNLIVDMMMVEDSFSEEVILDSYVCSINSAIEQLMSRTDKEYSEDENLLAFSLSLQCMIKACFAMMSEREYRMVEDVIFEKIDELVDEENDVSKENIVDIINNRNEYRSKIKKISIRPLSFL